MKYLFIVMESLFWILFGSFAAGMLLGWFITVMVESHNKKVLAQYLKEEKNTKKFKD